MFQPRGVLVEEARKLSCLHLEEELGITHLPRRSTCRVNETL